MLQRLGIGQRIEILDGLAVNDIAHSQLDDLAALGAGNISHLDDL